ncbi:biotin transport system ATP-binding protein [Streptosporangium becharense]|uniref:energy-coupling factor ABC transporter ATP-binding protein n=1 Tax=Streptosporangium becharense TaxID=1816182 RepID=UPI0017B0AA0B|nr:ABC transporter ATP-binding protein [Streptosporangium becharense]MBB2910721.1 biotin transport system ATP-binding protein [Streptosporangium becharense]
MSVSFDGRPVLREVSLRLAERRIGVIGQNGSGKSTLARLLNGLVLPDEGSVRVDGLDTGKDARRVRARVGFVFQNPDNQIVFPIVSEDMAFGLKNLGVPKREIPGRVTAALGEFGIGHLAERQAHLLSGGEKQLVALAAVMVMRPSVVVFDEPTTLLDLRNRNLIRDAVARMEQSAVMVTHDLDLLAGFDRVLVVHEGRIAYDADPASAVGWYREHCS